MMNVLELLISIKEEYSQLLSDNEMSFALDNFGATGHVDYYQYGPYLLAIPILYKKKRAEILVLDPTKDYNLVKISIKEMVRMIKRKEDQIALINAPRRIKVLDND